MKIPKNLKDKIYWINPTLDASVIAERIKSLDLLVSDIDETIVPCQATKTVLHKIFGQPYNLLNPRLWDACISYVVDSRHNAWEKFRKHLLLPEDRLKIEEKYTEEYAASTLYPGFMDFLSVLPQDMLKIYLTGNIQEIAQGYIKATGFNDAICGLNKEEGIRKVVGRFPTKQRIWFSGDHQDDDAVLDFFNHRIKKKEMDYFLSIRVCASPRSVNEKYDINIARDYTGIYELLHNQGMN